MRYTHNINASRCIEWGLDLKQGALMDIINQASSWASAVQVEGKTYYWVSRNKIISEIPLAYSKPDTVYRALKLLAEKEVIEHIKEGKKDLIRLTEKGKKWNVAGTIQGDAKLGNKSDSEINPDKLGNKSENNSDENPTYNNTSNNPNTSNNKTKELAKKPTKYKPEKPDGVSEQVWDDLLALRKTKRAVESQTAWNTIFNALEKAQQATGHSLEQIITEWVSADWKGFRFDWYINRTKASNQLTVNNQGHDYGQQRKLSAAEEFAAKLEQQLAEDERGHDERTVN